MSRKKRDRNERWSLSESVSALIPINENYDTMRSRNARTGVLFVLPFILGFLIFMAKPMIQSVWMSLNKVVLVPGQGYQLTWNKAAKLLHKHLHERNNNEAS